MRIGLLSPSIYMSTTKYKDMIFAPRELVILLANGLVKRGHEVYLFTSPDIKTDAKIVAGDERLIKDSYIEEKMSSHPSERFKWASFYNLKRNYEIDLTQRCYKMALKGKLDIIHSYHDTLAHFFDELIGFPTVYTLHDPLPTNKNSLIYWLLDKYTNQNYVSISNSFRQHPSLRLNFIQTVYHGLDLENYKQSLNKGEYLAFMGRMAPEKGLDSAITVAKEAKIPLKIATSTVSANANVPYYKDIIEPIMHDSLVTFTGFMDKDAKCEFLGEAIGLIFPLQWEEPFGMVMIEAMACGTPVIAYNRGSVPEIVRDGVTGFIIDSDDEDRSGKGSWIIKKQGVEGLIEAVKRIGEIDRKACREHVEENFTVEKMVEGYEKVYRKILAS